MPPPTTYTEMRLAEYMRRSIRRMADLFGWTNTAPGGDYQDAVDATLRVLGTSDIATLTTTAQVSALEAVARREAWRQVVAGTASEYTYGIDGGQFNRSDLFKMATVQLVQAEALASAALAAVDPTQAAVEAGMGPLLVGTVAFADDPFLPETEVVP